MSFTKSSDRYHIYHVEVSTGPSSDDYETYRPPNSATLVARCYDSNGKEQPSTLDLNKCIANIDGELRWCRDGNFAFSSDDIWVDREGILHAKCKTTNNIQAKYSTLDLNKRIANVNGCLVDTSV
ncbi:hypothetical protein HK097_000159 [Rhizophlyctis rosea]|uniref:Cyanovirin-N domain-containing protein n=1 Tax=Rhizophlyctis rosea TaxID=64517 RepID=A0AAD5SDY2_9FUNG|nr:hypothetical protein HK097_000159 [Rhizophlyctis rosea]